MGIRSFICFSTASDESRLLIRNVASFLAGEFNRDDYPVERLWLRIACRAAEWPEILERALANRWPEGVGVYELAPLRRCDVELAAQQSDLSASKVNDS